MVVWSFLTSTAAHDSSTAGHWRMMKRRAFPQAIPSSHRTLLLAVEWPSFTPEAPRPGSTGETSKKSGIAELAVGDACKRIASLSLTVFFSAKSMPAPGKHNTRKRFSFHHVISRSMKPTWLILVCLTLGFVVLAHARETLQNDRYTLDVAADGVVSVRVEGMPAQTLRPEFTVLWSDSDPQCQRNASHPNYPVAPRTAVRWRNREEPLAELNAWVGSAEFASITGMTGLVKADGGKRVWEYRDAEGKVKVRVTGDRAFDTTRVFGVGQRFAMKPVRCISDDRGVRWEYAANDAFGFAAKLSLPIGDGDPALNFTLTPRRDAFYSVAFTGAPDAALGDTIAVPQECDARSHKQFDFVVSEADLHLPRAQVSTTAGSVALVAEPGECRFRLPTIEDSRFGFMLASDGGRLKPVLLAPLLGGAESKMHAGDSWQFSFRCMARAGDWKESYAHIARNILGFRNLRDNSGPGSLNATLERVMDFLADRRGGNHAMWDSQQKYFDYFTDKTGIFKPFSPLYGLGAAIVTDDEEFFRTRARPAVEFALSRKKSVFAPYDNADNKQANSAGREVGAPYLSYAQLVSLDALFQRRSPVLRSLAESKGPTKGKLSDALARWQLTGDASALDEAKQMALKASHKGASFGEEDFFDLLDLASITHEPGDVSAALEAAYHAAAKVNLYPMPPDANVTVDRGGVAPVHRHSFGRHKNIWGFPPPQPVHVPEQTVPAWRISRLGLPGIAYPIEYWMNTHGAMMRAAGLANDTLLRDIASSGMVGRFGNYPGDNRSQDSLLPESPDAVETMPWNWNFATVNPGHAWDFAAQVLDFIVSDAFERSHGGIDFPAVSAAGSPFRVRVYGADAGVFYGDKGVHLWLPRGLVKSDNKQLDWVAAHGNGQCYLALWNQSAQEQKANIALDATLVECAAQDARVWRDNRPAAPVLVQNNHLSVAIPPKGIIAFAIPARVKPRLQAKLYADAPALDTRSHTEIAAPFGKIHAMLLRAGADLTSAFVYTEALPEHVIAARLLWRQGEGKWQEIADDIYPYEFSPELRDDAGVFQCVLEIEDDRRQIQRSALITLGSHATTAMPDTSPFPLPATAELIASPNPSDDFIAYLQRAANGDNFGLRGDGRFYPYSTPQGRRIAWRQIIWDNALFAVGCTHEEAEQHLRSDLAHTLIALKKMLAARTPAMDFDQLNQRQQETLLDFAFTESIEALRPEFLTAVLARDWPRVAQDHLYIRYAGHAPDHLRNKAFAQRWNIQ
jgi:hypothetical protein